MTSDAKPTAKIQLPEMELECPIVVGTENEKSIDIRALRAQSGYITLDDGYGNTGACESKITYIDGEKGILRYRGYSIEDLAEHSTFVETALLLIYGELPTKETLSGFRKLLTDHEMLHEGLHNMYDGFPAEGHPMAILSAMINACSCYHPDIMVMEDETTFMAAAARLMSKVRTIAAAAYKTSVGQPHIYPSPNLSYCRNFLHMMFSIPFREFDPDPDVVSALRLFLILHADHEQNCSTSTVRMVASSQANLFASCAAGVCALWGPLHGGANMAVIKMLHELNESQIDLVKFMEGVKRKEFRLMGFGHRVYKNYDPRARILKKAVDKVIRKANIHDPFLDIARKLEEVALEDPYFIERKLYPNVDFYSGILLRTLGIPLNMFTVMFAIGRMPGWIAHWKEVQESDSRIHRPRQVYTGYVQREYIPCEKRGIEWNVGS
ncbi:MAG: citrate synthase [Verrucomicrobiota bacterium]|mgnify:CR=1 FL=1|jgi:citrate synthase|nr:citrate synthase [Verrucomicrobiota bacterium]HCF94602.1 citrate (Si)-synthase [Verrucomicrobiota bacterium]